MSELVGPVGVGGCVYRAVPLDVRRGVLARVIETGNPVSPTLRDAAAKVAQSCTGRAYAASDIALVGAVVGAFGRSGVALYLVQHPAVGQAHLDAAWRDGAAAERAPFVDRAAAFLAGSMPPPALLDSEMLRPLSRRLALDSRPLAPRVTGMLLRYFEFTALGEASEKALAAGGATPVSQRGRIAGRSVWK